MTPTQLKAARRELGLNQTEMAQQLKTPRRTYVDWERGSRRIPGVCEVAVELMLFNLRRFIAALKERL